MRRIVHGVRRGDTIIEVIIAITIFCLVAIISVNLMNNGINNAQGSLELTMARNEIDAQAEALRFIQNSFIAERELKAEQQQYTQLWKKLTQDYGDGGLAIDASELPDFDVETCEAAYENTMDIKKAFVINTRLIEPGTGSYFDYGSHYEGSSSPGTDYSTLMGDIIVSARLNPGTFTTAPIYPRLIFSHHAYLDGASSSDALVEQDKYSADRLYRMVARAEGIWIIAVRGVVDKDHLQPEYYDFYIRSCWYEPGSGVPSLIGTIVRLYNPEVIE